MKSSGCWTSSTWSVQLLDSSNPCPCWLACDAGTANSFNACAQVEHQLDKLLGGLMTDILKHKPQDPIQFIIDTITLGAELAMQVCKETTEVRHDCPLGVLDGTVHILSAPVACWKQRP